MAEKATAKACGNRWRTWMIYMQREWCKCTRIPAAA